MPKDHFLLSHGYFLAGQWYPTITRATEYLRSLHFTLDEALMYLHLLYEEECPGRSCVTGPGRYLSLRRAKE